jgi:integrase
MASVVNDPNGLKRIIPTLPDGRRPSIRLGKCDKRTAEQFRLHVGYLESAMNTATPIVPETVAWLAELAVKGPDLRKKLTAFGLAAPADEPTTTTVGAFLNSYLERKTDIKPASLLTLKQIVGSLREFFGNRSLQSINAGDAEDFKRWLGTEARHQNVKRESAPGLSPVTVAKRMQGAMAIFNDAMKRELIAKNPFAGVKTPRTSNPDRQVYVPAETIEKLIGRAPSAEWRLMLAMSRYMGVRVPSEPFSMTWDCVDWAQKRLRVPSPKTEVHGKCFRIMPILPAVLSRLEDVFNQAPEGSVYIFNTLRKRESARHAEKGFWGNLNLRTPFLRMLKRAGIKPWPKLWHNLRASAQTDLADRFPIHVVCEWLGNTQAVARKHYLQTTDEHFEAAIASVARKAAQSPSGMAGNEPKAGLAAAKRLAVLPMISGDSEYDVIVNKDLVRAVGLEPTTS